MRPFHELRILAGPQVRPPKKSSDKPLETHWGVRKRFQMCVSLKGIVKLNKVARVHHWLKIRRRLPFETPTTSLDFEQKLNILKILSADKVELEAMMIFSLIAIQMPKEIIVRLALESEQAKHMLDSLPRSTIESWGHYGSHLPAICRHISGDNISLTTHRNASNYPSHEPKRRKSAVNFE